MGRRKRETPSSLELFLDTICNTFGGIVFLAILLSIIVQNRTRHTVTPTQGKVVTPDEARALALRTEHLQDQLRHLSQLIEELRTFQPGHEDRRTDELAEKLSESQRRLATETEQQLKLARELSQQSQHNEQLAQAQSQIENEAEKAKKSLAEEKSRLSGQIDQRMQILNLPRIESVAKPPIILMMRFGKVYRLFVEGSHVDRSQLIVTEDTTSKYIVVPKRESGWRLSDLTDRVMYQKYLSNYPASSYVIRAFVWPDSFAQFAHLKRLLLESNYQYELNPYSEGDSITFVRGGSMPMVQ